MKNTSFCKGVHHSGLKANNTSISEHEAQPASFQRLHRLLLTGVSATFIAGAAMAAITGNVQAAPFWETIIDGETRNESGAPYTIPGATTHGGLAILGSGQGIFGQLMITTSVVQGDGIYISTDSGSRLTITSAQGISTIATTGDGAAGIRVSNNGTIELTNTNIATSGNSGAHGIALTGGGTATLNNVNIESKYSGSTVQGVVSHNVGLFVTNGSTVDMTGGSIKTNDNYVAWAVEVQGAGSDVKLTDVAVTTTGSGGSSGIRLNNAQKNMSPKQPSDPSGSGSLTMIRGSVTTTGEKGHGVFVEDYGTFEMDGTKIRTSGKEAHGVAAENNTTITIDNADIKTTGTDAYGVTTGASTVNISNTRIETGTSSTNNGFGIQTGSMNANITVDNTTVITNGGNSHGVWLAGTTPGTGKITITDSEIIAKGRNSNGVGIQAGNAEISNTTISASIGYNFTPAVVIASDGANVTLTDSTVKSTGTVSLILPASFPAALGIVSDTGSRVDVIRGSVTTVGYAGHGLVVRNNSSLTTNGTTVSTSATTAYALQMSGSSAAVVNSATLTDTVLTAKAAAVNIASGTGNVELNGAATTVTGNGTWLNVAASAIANLTAQTGAQVTGKVTTASGGTSNVAIDSGAAWNISGSSTVTSLSFDGGILRYLQAGATDIASPNLITLKAGGMIADTNGFDNQIAQELTGIGGLTKIGDGTLTLQAVNSYTGTTRAQTGTLLVGDIANPTASVAGPGLVDSGATLSGLGTVAGTVTNNGTVAAWNSLIGHEADPISNFTVGGMVNQGTIRLAGGTGGDPLAVGNTLTVNGNYAGNGGLLILNTVLGTDDSKTDMLIISGGTATGHTGIIVFNVGGRGAYTTGDGIKIVDAINGATTAADAFMLSGRVAEGIYEYSLKRGSSTSSDSWYLVNTMPNPDPDPEPEPEPEPGPSPEPAPKPAPAPEVPNIRPEVPVNAAIMPLALEYGYAVLDTLHERVGETWVRPMQPAYEERIVWCKDKANNNRCVVRTPVTPGATDREQWFSGAWARIFADHGERQKNGGWLLNRGANYDYTLAGIQAGFDVYGREASDGSIDKAGIYVAYGQLSGNVKQAWGSGKAGTVDFDAYTVGAYWTHLAAAGWYTDAVVQGTWYSTTAKSILGQQVKPDGWGLLLSLEGGYAFNLGNGFKLEPQAQLVYQHLSFDDVQDNFGRFAFSDIDSVRGRIGLRLAKTWAMDDMPRPRLMTAWVRANIWHEFSSSSRTTVSTLSNLHSGDVYSPLGGTWGEINIGVSGQVSENTSLFASASYNRSLDGKGREGWDGRLGLTVRW